MWGLSRLVKLDLSGNGLTGQVPVEILNLTNLRTLDLRGNDLSGCLPSGMQDHLGSDSKGYGLEFCN